MTKHIVRLNGQPYDVDDAADANLLGDKILELQGSGFTNALANVALQLLTVLQVKGAESDDN